MKLPKEEQALYDKLQMRLTEKGIEPNNFKFAVFHFQHEVKDKLMLCPFCLETQHFSEFEYDKGLYKCKNCKNRITEITLRFIFRLFNQEKPDIKEFAKWVYGYRLNGFFQKIIKFEDWNKKLRDLGFSYDFWEYYKQFKGENKQEEKEENE